MNIESAWISRRERSMNKTLNQFQTMFTVAAAVLTLATSASAQVDNPVVSAGGAVLADGTMLVVGEVAIGTIGTGPSEIDLGAIPCWLETPCLGDIDGNGVVNLSDLTVLLSNFGTPTGAGLEDGDLQGDGDVDLSDLTLLLSVYGATCP
jgi:hypothetical protein